MSHTILLKHGWEVILETRRFISYQLNEKMLIVWNSGNYKIYDIE